MKYQAATCCVTAAIMEEAYKVQKGETTLGPAAVGAEGGY